MSAQPQSTSVIDFFQFYMQNDIPGWLLPFCMQNNDNNWGYYDASSYELIPIWNEQCPYAIPVPYIPGKISFVEVPSDKWAISSKFSGCKMASYYKEGKRYVCHIAINDRACKTQNEELFERDDQIHKSCIFAPFEIIQKKDELSRLKNWNIKWMEGVYGLITGTNECYSFVVGEKEQSLRIVAWAQWGICEKQLEIIEMEVQNLAEKKCIII